MYSIRRFLTRARHRHPARTARRNLLKTAKTRDCEAYLALAAYYIDLACVFFGASFPEPDASRRSRVARLFLSLWQNLRYAERFTDFEQMLARALMESEAQTASTDSPNPLVTQLRHLTPRTRFAFLTYELEKWPLSDIARVLRTRMACLHRMLSEARAELCGFSWGSLTEEERDCLEAVSYCLDQSPNLRSNRALRNHLKTLPRVAQIRSDWLELRPELVEVRLRYIPSQEAREDLLRELYAAIENAPMERPPLVERVVNTIHLPRPARKNKVS